MTDQPTYTHEGTTFLEKALKTVSAGNALRVALTIAAFMLLGPVIGIVVGVIAFIDYQLKGKIFEAGKNLLSDSKKEEHTGHTILLGNAIRIGLVVGACMLLGPIAGICAGVLAFMDYQSQGKFSEAGGNVLSGIKNILDNTWDVLKVKFLSQETEQAKKGHSSIAQDQITVNRDTEVLTEAHTGKIEKLDKETIKELVKGLYTKSTHTAINPIIQTSSECRMR